MFKGFTATVHSSSRLVALFVNLYWTVRLKFYTRRLVHRIVPQLRQAALRKFGSKLQVEPIVHGYLVGRAAQMIHPLVDDLMRLNPGTPTLLGNKLVTSAAAKAAAVVLKSHRRRSTDDF